MPLNPNTHNKTKAPKCHLSGAFQRDVEGAFYRSVKRDRRRADDKYAAQFDRSTFEDQLTHMQNPAQGEDYVVVSGKHLFNMQQSAVVAKLRALGVLANEDANSR